MKNAPFILAALLGVIINLAACSGGSSNNSAGSSADTVAAKDTIAATPVKPTGKAPAWAPGIKPEMLAVIEKLESYGDKPITELSPALARSTHTPADAVMALMIEHHIPKPKYNVDTLGKDIAVTGGTIHARIYIPKTGKPSNPIIVYYHGGGFVIGSIDVYDAPAATLADKVGAVVVSVSYRLAPEHKFPTAHNDAFEAYKWAVTNASSLQGDPKKVAVAGESAGANLALNTAIMARDNKVMLPTAILAVYPVAGSDTVTRSYKRNSTAKPLDKAMMLWFMKTYLNNIAEAADPRINLVMANLRGLPPTTVITDQIDPLQSEGIALVGKLKAAGVAVDTKNWDGVTHEFFGMGAVVPEAKEAQDYAANQLKKAFGL
jgi:acetyl esterase